MFYLGLVTIKEARLDISLQIPNETVKRSEKVTPSKSGACISWMGVAAL